MRNLFAIKKGFTLMEMLIAVAVFSLFLTAVSGTYFAISRAVFDANSLRKLYSSSQDLMIFLTNEIRNKTIDYACYEETELSQQNISDNFCRNERFNPDNDLILRNKEGDKRFIVKFDPQSGSLVFGRFNKVKNISGDEWIPEQSVGNEKWVKYTLSENINLKDLRFRIFPGRNPFKYAKKDIFQFQPAVTITLSVQTRLSYDPNFVLPIQTTVVSRVYDKIK